VSKPPIVFSQHKIILVSHMRASGATM